jgi:hypothetical protein
MMAALTGFKAESINNGHAYKYANIVLGNAQMT